jgi:hypothetical protein
MDDLPRVSRSRPIGENESQAADLEFARLTISHTGTVLRNDSCNSSKLDTRSLRALLFRFNVTASLRAWPHFAGMRSNETAQGFGHLTLHDFDASG